MTPAVWVAIGSGVIALLSLAFTVYRETREKSKKLAWATLYNASILRQMNPNHVGRLTLQWDGNGLAEPRVVGVELTNTGRVELKRDDISMPITVEISDGTIISADVSLRPRGAGSTRPWELTVQDARSVQSKDPVLNPGDSLLFELLVDGGKADPKLSMHAAGFDCQEAPEDSVSLRMELVALPWPYELGKIAAQSLRSLFR